MNKFLFLINKINQFKYLVIIRVNKLQKLKQYL